MRLDFLAAAFLVSLGVVGAGYFVGQTMYNSQVAVNTAEAKGLAERRVESDVAYWTIGFELVGKKNRRYRKSIQDG